MRGITAVGSSDDVAAKSGRTARAAVAARAAIGEAGADREVGIDVSRSVPGYRPLSLSAREFALEELAAAANGAERIAIDDVERRVRSIGVSPPCSDFFGVGLGNPFVQSVRGGVSIHQLV